MHAGKPKKLTFTFDLEDNRTSNLQEKRYSLITRQVLDLLSEHNIRGTFFVVGQLAKNDPELIREISQRGHEIACHSYDHTPLSRQTPQQFKTDTQRAKSILEDISGIEVYGYRAPIFSLTKDTLWALDSLKEIGFSYSSSILPAKSPLYGFPKAPRHPFRWPNGLLEIPAPVTKFGTIDLPYLGGIYLRYLPAYIVQKAIDKSAPRQSLWIYCHPYDFDADEPFFKMKGTSLLVSLLLWFNRKHTFKKIENLASNESGTKFNGPFNEQIANDAFANAPTEQSLRGSAREFDYTMAG